MARQIGYMQLRSGRSCLPQGTARGIVCLDPCGLADFVLGPVIGTGSFGRVSLGRHRATSTVCAIKALSKAHLLKQGQVLWQRRSMRRGRES